MAIKHTHRQLGYALEEIVGKLVQSGELSELFSRFSLSYSIPQYYREFLSGEAIAQAESRP
jgi:hypothetical protein